MTKDSPIAFDEDIIQEVAKRLDMPIDKIRHHYDFFNDLILHLVSKPDLHSVKLYKFGTFHKKILLMKAKSEFLQGLLEKGKRVKPMIHTKLEYLKGSLENFYSSEQKDNPYSVHYKRSRVHNYYFNLKKTFKELEEWQNK